MNSGRYEFEKDLARASTLPAEWYREPSMLRLEVDRIFARTWQLAGRSDQVREPGDFFTTVIADEPVIVVRGTDSRVRAMSNVCRHRAGPVARESGRCKAFRCQYHGWVYSLGGRLVTAPEFEDVEQFEKESVRLPEFRVATWGGLLFLNLHHEGASLETYLGDLCSREDLPDLAGFGFARRKEWQLNCNWKAYVDNYLEGYHIPVVHPGLNRELDYSAYWTETKPTYSIQHAPLKTRAGRIPAWGAEAAARYFWVFPNLMLNVYPDNFSTNLILPLGPEKTLTIFDWYFRNPESPEVQERISRTVEFSDEIQVEDIAICEAVQRGLGSRTYRTGRYSVRRENGVHHYHGLIWEHLFPH
jgi:choline monooxygenase